MILSDRVLCIRKERALDGATCERGITPDCLTVRVPAGLVAKTGHVPPNGGTTSEEKASIPVRKKLARMFNH